MPADGIEHLYAWIIFPQLGCQRGKLLGVLGCLREESQRMSRTDGSGRELFLKIGHALHHDGMSLSLTYQTVDLSMPTLAENQDSTSYRGQFRIFCRYLALEGENYWTSTVYQGDPRLFSQLISGGRLTVSPDQDSGGAETRQIRISDCTETESCQTLNLRIIVNYSSEREEL